MNSETDSQIEKYDEIDRRSEERSLSMKQMIAQISPQFIMAHGSEIVRGCQELQALSIQARTSLEQLRMKYSHDSEKFTKLLRGAERRLDRQLDDLSAMRRMLIMMPAPAGDMNLIAQQQRILDAISMAQESFDREIDRLYDL